MRVTVLGHRGMLGHVVARYFREAGLQVHTLEDRFTAPTAGQFIRKLNQTEPDWCVNCVGIGPGRGASAEQMREANSALPRSCVDGLREGGMFLHASTDGIFVADRAARRWNEPGDAQDDYGMSKIEAEAAVKLAGGYIIRCSIIGPEQGPAKNLLQWLLNQTGTVQGFVNQMWNGITTLEWAKTALPLILGNISLAPSGRILQPACEPPVTKYELLRMIRDEWNAPVKVAEGAATVGVQRTLIPNIPTPGLREQLRELREWYGNGTE